ncbi:aminopeptidase [Coemansia pectinata]|uniref:Aminopeptidase n=1 Tax=Coemansia pectinata TaxID=1052879 RepID=A0A9W8H2U2_9FUNG|nr:aminopeptidase [Coemansia pectinata]
MTNLSRAARAVSSRLNTHRGCPSLLSRSRAFHAAANTNRSFLSSLLQTAKSNNPITSQWYGQPTHETHPELVGPAEVTHGIAKSEFEARRQKLVKDLPLGSTLLLFSAQMHFVSPHVFHSFRQDSDFYYLTGWNEPDSVVAIEKSATASRGYIMTMFVNAKDPKKEMWEGPRNGIEAAVSLFGADEARPIAEFRKYTNKLTSRLQDRKSRDDVCIFADLDTEHGLLRSRECTAFKDQLRRENMGSHIHRLSPLVQQLRLIKSPAEIQLMREAGRISAHGFGQLMQRCRPGLSESTLQTVFEQATKMALVSPGEDGSVTDRSALSRPAYVPVFASGEHALCMHYVQNSSPVKSGELILVDAGAEYAAYASDITRTFPVNGRFSQPQRDLYSALLSVHEQMIKLCHVASGYSLNEIHRRSTKVLATELKQIGLDVSDRDIDEQLFPHHIGHYLGMDVHDTVDINRSQQLKRNMVVTIEPGIYVPYDSKFPKAFHGIGIRIEDDIVVGQAEADIENLTARAPRSVDEIEACVGSVGWESKA